MLLSVLLFAFVAVFVSVFFLYLHQYLCEIRNICVNPDFQEGRVPSGGGRKMAAEKKEDSADEKWKLNLIRFYIIYFYLIDKKDSADEK